VSRARTWWPIALSLAAAVALLYGVVLPGGYLTWLWVAMVLWAVAAVVWMVSLAGRSWLVRSVLPVVSVVTMVVACSGVVGRVLFPLHRPGLEQLATAPLGGSHGLYRFASVWSNDGCVAYVTDDSGMSYFSGLVRCTPGVQPSPNLGDTAGDAVFEPLGDDWYAFSVPRSGWQVWGFNPFAVGATAEV
jgi:hypothetical protein